LIHPSPWNVSNILSAVASSFALSATVGFGVLVGIGVVDISRENRRRSGKGDRVDAISFDPNDDDNGVYDGDNGVYDGNGDGDGVIVATLALFNKPPTTTMAAILLLSFVSILSN
jgi:hypothetical protein